MDAAEFERQLKLRGWRYDLDDEVFRDGEELIGLVPDMTLDELARYQDAKYDQLRRRFGQTCQGEHADD